MEQKSKHVTYLVLKTLFLIIVKLTMLFAGGAAIFKTRLFLPIEEAIASRAVFVIVSRNFAKTTFVENIPFCA